MVALVSALVWLASLGSLAHAGGVTTTTTTTLPSTTSTTLVTTTTSTTIPPSTTSTTVPPTTTSTTVPPSTTSTTTTTSSSSSTSSSTSSSSSSSTSTTSSTLPPPEECGNCLDDDGDGLTDFEDADCCETPPGTLTVERLTLLPIGAVSRIELAASSLPAVPSLVPSTQTLIVQLAPDDATPILCASVDALHFRTKRDRATFVDRSGGVPSARGITNARLQRLGTGLLRLTLRGARAGFHTPAAEQFRVAVALRSLVTPGAPVRCVTRTVDVVPGKKGGSLELP